MFHSYYRTTDVVNKFHEVNDKHGVPSGQYSRFLSCT